MSPWARLDDNFHAHPRTLQSGLDGNGLFARSLSYCAHYLTDGYVPSEWAEAQGGGKKLCQRLVDAGLWESIESGYIVKGYLERNPSREQVESERNRERGKKAGQRGKSPHLSPGDNPGDVVPLSPRGKAAS